MPSFMKVSKFSQFHLKTELFPLTTNFADRAGKRSFQNNIGQCLLLLFVCISTEVFHNQIPRDNILKKSS